MDIQNKQFASWLMTISAFLFGISLSSLYISRSTIAITLGLSLICALIASPTYKIRDFKQAIPTQLWIFLGIILMGLGASIFTSLKPDTSFSTWLRLASLPVSIAFLCYLLISKIALIHRVLTVSLFICLIYSVLGLYFNNHFLLLLIGKETSRDFNLTLKPLLTVSLLSLPIALLYLHKNMRLNPVYSIGTFLFFGVLILFSLAKSTLSGFLIMTATCGLVYLIRLQNKKIILSSLCLFGISFSAALIWLKEHIYTLSQAGEKLGYLPVWLIDLHRQLIWQFSWENIQLSPLFGYGINASNYLEGSSQSVSQYLQTKGVSFTDPTAQSVPILPSHTHNWIIEIALDTGLVGSIPFIIAIVSMFVFLTSRYVRTGHLALMCAIAINAAYWGSGLFNFSYWSAWWQTSYYVSFFFCLALYFDDQSSEKELT
ncbi:membrane hypothetical protein [Candidatus Terasakiella magnetica]|uniref:O-antigen ligase-related domain-containing protein n=1 Tax=Candidatus Terasakiella magnetica TaxID=1867952 RepID=A0A1C3RG67_9PROT|nr:O-antigen ligase family protein [Candidatus Terasakiella magnetica]SCA56204.1 membrane hypothetical protein [Candidatus Terasakiella magnetica]